jgi:hypothetical protein
MIQFGIFAVEAMRFFTISYIGYHFYEELHADLLLNQPVAM